MRILSCPLTVFNGEQDDIGDYDGWDEWVFDIFGDKDLITFLYSYIYLPDGHSYHFDCWLERQFYCE